MGIRKTYIKLVITVISCLGFGQLNAQDASFSQAYANPLYLSPSFTGLTNGSRLSLSYRDQWPGIPNTYKTFSLAADHFFDKYKSGVGIMLMRDDAGHGKLVRQDISLLYAYEFEVTENVFIRPGIQFKYAERNVNLIDAIFPSDINQDGTSAASGYYGNEENKRYLDAAASAMIYNDNFWFGVAMANLIKQDVSLTDIETFMPLKTSFYGGYKYMYNSQSQIDQSITAAFNYRMQQGFNQLDFGMYWYFNPVELGLWYRGIPFASQDGLINNDGLIFILGVNVANVRIAYSYDYTMSGLSGYSNGANELSLIYRFNQNLFNKSHRGALPCSSPGIGKRYKRAGSKRSIF